MSIKSLQGRRSFTHIYKLPHCHYPTWTRQHSAGHFG